MSAPPAPKDELVVVREEKRPEPQPPARDTRPVATSEEDGDDDWGAVPAFLRRSKLK